MQKNSWNIVYLQKFISLRIECSHQTSYKSRIMTGDIELYKKIVKQMIVLLKFDCINSQTLNFQF